MDYKMKHYKLKQDSRENQRMRQSHSPLWENCGVLCSLQTSCEGLRTRGISYTSIIRLWFIFSGLISLVSAASKCPSQFFHKTVPENTPIDTELFSINLPVDTTWTFAPDSSQISFAKGYLGLDASSGKITLLKQLDAEMRNPTTNAYVRNIHYVLRCSYTESGSDFHIDYDVQVYITNVNDHVPKFINAPFYKEVNELTPISTTVFMLMNRAVDDDYYGAINFYKILGGSDGKFKLTGATSEGKVAVAAELDYDDGQREYVLNISATDNGVNYGDKSLSNTTTLTIRITDGDDQDPIFEKQQYSLEITEEMTPNNNISLDLNGSDSSSTIGKTLFTTPPIKAYDQDFGINQTVVYSIGTGNVVGGINYFNMDASNGGLIPMQRLDRETHSTWHLKIKACQTDKPTKKCATADLEVKVKDVNDNRPMMVFRSYTLSISENPKIGALITTVHATDPDEGDNAAFHYKLVDSSGAFQLDPISGEIRVKNPSILDREKQDTFTIEAYAKETKSTDQFESHRAKITITIEDRNDNTPQFYPSLTYVFKLVENATIDTTVGQVYANDTDLNSNAKVKYALVFASNNGSYIFAVDADTGRVYTINTLTDPYFAEYRLTISATDQPQETTERRSNSCLVIVDVENLNNHPPKFINEPYLAKISESATKGTIVIQLTVTDMDGPAGLKYRIVNGDPDNKFNITLYGAVIVQNQLDRDNVSSYSLTVQVADDSYKTTSTLDVTVIDANDNAPKFTQSIYKFSIKEEQPAGLIAGTVTATDADEGSNAKIEYRFNTKWAQNFFSIDPSSGEIKTTVDTLDREKLQNYEFLVVAQDQGEPNTLSGIATVIVSLEDINDNAPKFEKSKFEVTIQENTIPKNFLTIKMVDLDDGAYQHVQFTISSGNAFLFEVTNIDNTTGAVSARREISLAFNAPKSYTLNISASNVRPLEGKLAGQSGESSAIVVIYVEDINDNIPVFTQNVYTFEITEDLPVDQSFGSVIAIDSDVTSSNRKIHYWISGGADSQIFRIDGTSGELFLHESLDRDPPKNNTYFELEVTVSDLVAITNGTVINITAIVKVDVKDVNDNAPVFSQASYVATVNESLSMTTEINLGISASDIDQGVNGEFYYLLQGTNIPFTIDQQTGLLKLNSLLDYEKGGKQYNFKVLAQDRGNPIQTGTADISITVLNLNDNPPQFKQTSYIFNISEALPGGTLVGRVEATDLDGNSIGYKLDNSVPAGVFTIDSIDGDIRTLIPLDRERNRTLAFDILATDGKFKTAVGVTVVVEDQNDNSPEFEQTTYKANLTENEPLRVLFQIKATDQDAGDNAKVTYSIISGNEDGVFGINTTSGQLSIIDGSKIDYNKRPVYYMVLAAKDDGLSPRSGFCTAVLTVTDVNNRAPVFKQTEYIASVKENQPTQTPVIVVSATDEDTVGIVEYGFIATAGVKASDFSIDKKTGVVSTGVIFDRETTDNYVLNASACDGKQCGYAKINVTVMDTNDYAPVFVEKSYVGYIQQNAVVDRSILQVNATDRDLENNQEITYWISNTDGKFKVDHDVGIVRVAGVLDRSVKDVYEMLVFAEDHGMPPLRSNVSLTIFVNNTNKNVPMFSEFSYEALIPENSTNGTFVLQVNATDNDDGKAGSVRLNILKGNDQKMFKMNPDGSIYLIKGLDFEKEKYYELTIEAKDEGGDPLSSTAIVRITISDINDNAPVFAPLPDVLHVSAQSQAGIVIYTTNATDADSLLNNNNKVVYSLLTHTDKFVIEESSGAISVKTAPLATGDYAVKVEATDQGSPKLSTEATLNVKVISSLDKIPVFGEMPFISKINEAIVVNAIVTNINAKLGGKGNEDDVGIYYNITEGNEQKYFKINSQSGVLTVAKKLDREAKPYHFLLVTAYNEADPQFTAQTGVIVELVDDKDTPPKFPFTRYDVVTAEDTPVGNPVSSIYAIDPDQNSPLVYTIVEDDSNGQFSILTESNKAVIKVAKILDRDLMPANSSGIYTLKVIASDGISNATTTVRILVKDVNDNNPQFPTQQYNKTVAENIGPGFEIIQVKATDLDRVDEGKLKYGITSGNDKGLFVLNDKTGVISRSMTKDLDRETQASYTLTVNATDSAGNTATVDVVITLSDINDNAPVFVGTPYVTTVNEGPDSLSLAFKVTITDKDAGNNAAIDFSILQGNDDKEFVIDTGSNVGTLRAVKELDREKQGLIIKNGMGVYVLTIKAQDRGSPSLSATTTVTVNAKDINDKPPKFEKQEYVVPVSEGSPLLFTITTIAASDPDEPINTNLTYSIEPEGNTDEAFIVDPQTGDIKLNKSLDITVQAMYNLTVKVTDGKQSSTAKMKIIVVDANDNNPIFKEAVYKFSVPENDKTNTTGQSVGEVSATDKDEGLNGEIAYQITSRNAQGLFAISQNGSITTAGILNREQVDKYFIIVTAEDKGKPSRRGTCEVEISILDVNDNPPVFVDEPYAGTVAEHAPPGTNVVVKPPITTRDADNGDNAKIKYELSGDDAQLFTIDGATGTIKVKSTTSSSSMDRETKDTLMLTVVAKDQNGNAGFLSASTNITITLTDINDQRPVFKDLEYQFKVSEEAAPNTEVGSVFASDGDVGANAMIQYSIVTGHDGKFYIDRLSGNIYVTGGLDRETVNQYTLNVSAQDRGVVPGPLEGFVNVEITILDYNDNAPKFDRSEISVDVAEEQAAPSFVTQVRANDEDLGENGTITYFMNASVPFAVSKDGNITTTEKLNREKTPEYAFQIYANDSGNPLLQGQSTIRVKVTDINDHNPTFEEAVYSANILEKSPVKSVIVWPRAMDPDEGDNAKLTYSLTGPGSQYFAINPDTGLITIAVYIDKNKLISEGFLGPNVTSNSGNNSTLDLTVTAKDAGVPSKSGSAVLYVKIDDISDDTPQFVKASYDVILAEESPKGTFVVQVLATTKDKTTVLNYELTKENEFFSLDKTSGNVTTTGKRLDREERMYYSFTVKVLTANRIPQRTSYAVVSVTLEDINDHSPTFADPKYDFTVNEGNHSIHALGTILAEDSDYGSNGTITYTISSGNEDETFQINNATGVLSVIKPLDREKKETYKLVVEATDGGGKKSSVLVTITVKDVNDNIPTFYGDPYSVAVNENDKAGLEVVRVYANDSDGGLNGQIFFSLLSGGDNMFFIENKDGYGILKTLRSLDYETTSSYEIKVAAVDLGNPPRSSTAQINVNVIDMNDNVPVFIRSIYLVNVTDALAVGSSVINLDAGRGEYSYNISGGDADGTFVINNNTGELTTAKIISARVKYEYLLDIMATDFHAPPSSATTKVQIYIADSSPFPMFDKKEYNIEFKENQSPGQLVIDLGTSDENIGRPVVYSIVSGNEAGNFRIVPSDGKLYCDKQLDRESVSKYILVVRAEAVKKSKTPKSRRRRATDKPNEATITINVADVNDHPPEFQRKKNIAGVPADATFNSHVIYIKATDKDSSDQGQLVFSIIPSTDGEYFYMDPGTGEVLSKISFGLFAQKEFAFRIMVKDGQGQGFNDTADLAVSVLSDSQQTILVANISPNRFRDKQDEIIGNLSQILGYEVRAEKLEPHVENVGSGETRVDVSKTDMYFYAVNLLRNTIVRKEFLRRKIVEKNAAIEELWKRFSIEGTNFQYISVKKVSYSIRTAEAALMALGMVIVIGCILGIIVVYHSWRKRQAEKHKNAMLLSRTLNKTGSESGVFLANPLYAESTADDENGEPLQIDEDGNPMIIVNEPDTAQSESLFSTTTSMTSIIQGTNGEIPVFSTLSSCSFSSSYRRPLVRNKRPKRKKSKTKKRKESVLTDKSTEFEEIFESSTDYDAVSQRSRVQPLHIVPVTATVTRSENDLVPGTEVVPMSEVEGLDVDRPRLGIPRITTSDDETSASVLSYCMNDSRDVNSSQDETSASVSSYHMNGNKALHSSQVSVHKVANNDANSPSPSQKGNKSLGPSPNVSKVNATLPPANKALNVERSPTRTDSVKGGQLTPARPRSTGDKIGGSVTSSRLNGSASSSMSHDSGMITMNSVTPIYNYANEDTNNNNNNELESTNIDSIFQEVFYGSDTCMSEDDAGTIIGSSDKSNMINSSDNSLMNDLGASDDIIVKPYVQSGGIVNPAYNNSADCNFNEEFTWL
ncbi:protocadherin Fat 4-like [Lineus longissimus]|uniref:protocadherin Fat 4-like n=1 Tax=Lineus longissimus TaxID=88925 RepID=UPI00315C898B